MTKRLESRENRLLLLEYLTTELQATKMLAVNKPEAIVSVAPEQPQVSFKLQYFTSLGNFMQAIPSLFCFAILG